MTDRNIVIRPIIPKELNLALAIYLRRVATISLEPTERFDSTAGERVDCRSSALSTENMMIRNGTIENILEKASADAYVMQRSSLNAVDSILTDTRILFNLE